MQCSMVLAALQDHTVIRMRTHTAQTVPRNNHTFTAAHAGASLAAKET